MISVRFRFSPELVPTELRTLCCFEAAVSESLLEERVDRCIGVSIGPALNLGVALVGGVSRRGGVGPFADSAGCGNGAGALSRARDGSCGRSNANENGAAKAVVLQFNTG